MTLDEEQQKKIEKMRKRIDLANKIRLAFMFIAVVLLVIIYFGNKFYAEASWYMTFVAKSYVFLTYDILLMLIFVLVKIGLTVRYNHFVKRL